MTEASLQHDPKTKMIIKDMLFTAIYAPLFFHLDKKLDDLIIQNTMLIGASHQSFVYKAEVYYIDNAPFPRRPNRLHRSLYKAMDEYLNERNKINTTEIPYVAGFITHVLNSSNNLCDYIRVLPESLHDSIKNLIATCPCQSQKLSEEKVIQIQEDNEHIIQMIKERMVQNLLL